MCACGHCMVDLLDIFHIEHVVSYNPFFGGCNVLFYKYSIAVGPLKAVPTLCQLCVLYKWS